MVVARGSTLNGGSRADGGCMRKGSRCWGHKGGVVIVVARGKGRNGGSRGDSGCARDGLQWWLEGQRWLCEGRAVMVVHGVMVVAQ